MSVKALPADVVSRAKSWIEGDPDPETQAELGRVVDAQDLAELRERMGELEFGTAGLRGVVGAGSGRMNRAVVIRTTRGLADYLLARVRDAKSRPVVVGYDGRLTSRQFADDTIAVLSAAGIPVRVFDGPVPTPLVAYAARQLSACAAVVVTASHNPPEYNGYKVYADNAAQIIPPVDGEIARRIAEVGPARDVKRERRASVEPVPAELFNRYLMELDTVRMPVPQKRELCIVYTPMHGVGWRYLQPAMKHAGYADLHVVPEQAEPDGRFPTVNFPNPEEPGALDLAQNLAAEKKADLILANDPDADRLAVCVSTATGRWVQLSGNQVGLLLADYLLKRAAKTPQPLVASSIVSSPMLGSIAAAYGAHCEQTLTGFKWIWNAALDLEAEEKKRFVFGYEEALGYSVGRIVRDKDGISAAVVFADLVQHCREQEQSLLEHLEGLYRQHGLWLSVQKSVVLKGSEGAAQIAAAMERLKADPPKEIGGHAVARFTDYTSGGSGRPRWLPDTSLVSLELEGGSRILVRPSGTEPKLKIYVDLRVGVAKAESVREKEETALAEARALAEAAAAAAGLG